MRDVVRANLIASEHPNAPGEIFNICTGQEIKILDLLDTLYELFPNAPEAVFDKPRAGDIYRSLGNPEFTAQTIGFRAEVSLAEGLKEASAWMQA